MSRFFVVAIGGAGGDLQPLVAAALRERGHEVVFAGDRSVQQALSPVRVDVRILPPELDLGPRLVAVIREAMAAAAGDIVAAGPLVEEQMAAWA